MDGGKFKGIFTQLRWVNIIFSPTMVEKLANGDD